MYGRWSTFKNKYLEICYLFQPLQASTVVILHPGSTLMWLGRATDHLPQSIPHVIARRKPQQCTVDIPDQTLLVRDGLDHPDSETQKELALSVIEQAIWSRKTSSGSRKHQTTVSQVRSNNYFPWIKLLSKRISFLIGIFTAKVTWENFMYFLKWCSYPKALHFVRGGESVRFFPSSSQYSSPGEAWEWLTSRKMQLGKVFISIIAALFHR